MDDFGTFPNATPRFGAALRGDNTWCVWDYQTGILIHIDTEEKCRVIADAWNEHVEDQTISLISRKQVPE